MFYFRYYSLVRFKSNTENVLFGFEIYKSFLSKWTSYKYCLLLLHRAAEAFCPKDRAVSMTKET